MKKPLAALFPLILISGITAVSVYQMTLSELSFIHLGLILIYIVWILFELRISFRDSSESHVSFDRFTREFYAVSQAGVITAAIFFIGNPSAWMQYAGSFIFITGLVVRISAVQYLGIYYSHTARLVRSHKVITAGPYSVIRHPAYAGMILIHIGMVLALYSPAAAAILIFSLLPSIVLRLRTEESMLMKLDGYAAYASKTKSFIPYIW